jgi:hypothetical protein
MGMVNVTKFDGSIEPFDRGKLVATARRLGAQRDVAERVVTRVERRVYEGISTRELLRMVRRYMNRYRPETKQRHDLRAAISLLRSKPDWERYVQLLLRAHGYDVTPNCLVRGRCVTNELDAIARRAGEDRLIEVKHHVNPHTRTSLDVVREVWAIFEDVREGYAAGLNAVLVTEAVIVTNTRFSKAAKTYAECRGVDRICWKGPEGCCLEAMIEEKRFYPVTLLRGLRRDDAAALGDVGVVTLHQLVAADTPALAARAGVDVARLTPLRRAATTLLARSDS